MRKDAAVDLAPGHKVGLTLANPVMPAAGCFGFGKEYDQLVEVESLGAVVVGPVTAGPRRGAEPPRTLPLHPSQGRMRETLPPAPGGLGEHLPPASGRPREHLPPAPEGPGEHLPLASGGLGEHLPPAPGGLGGVLLHTGLANPGVAAAVRRYGRAWARSPVPVIVHVAGTSPNEAASCCWRLASVEAVAGIELGLPDIASGPAGLAELFDEVTDVIRAARAAASQPLIVRLPLVWAAALCRAAVEAGADALTVAAPPRGTVWHAPSDRFVTGRLYGPFVLPLALHALRRVAELVPVPLIGCGGIHSAADGLAFLRAGATAIQVGGALWHDPASMTRIARGLSSTTRPETLRVLPKIM